jgi:hypothetical protein
MKKLLLLFFLCILTVIFCVGCTVFPKEPMKPILIAVNI